MKTQTSNTCHSSGRRRHGHRARKERVLHTRISEQLSEDIRNFAADLRVPASNLVRNVLEEVFAVGGASVYAAALPVADRLYLTRVHTEVEGETRMPGPLDPVEAGFRLVNEERREPDERHALAFTFQTWERGTP